MYGLMIGFYDAHLMGATSVSKESLGPKNSYLKLPVPVFDFILKRITPIVEKQETHLRQTISPGARLEATLLFLITGDYYSRLQHLTRIHESTSSHSAHGQSLNQSNAWGTFPRFIKQFIPLEGNAGECESGGWVMRV